jgi:proline dehydrogenase
MLLGIRDGEQLRLAGLGAQMRVCLPYGGQWYGYFMCRLAERPANLGFFLRSSLERDCSPAVTRWKQNGPVGGNSPREHVLVQGD